MRLALLSLFLVTILVASGCVASSGPQRTVLDSPTSPYATVNIEYAPFEADWYLRDMNVLFRGKVKSAKDVQVSWKNSEGGQMDAYLAVREVSVKDVLYGALPQQDTVQATGNPSWLVGERDVQLWIGEEYFFLAHVYNQADRQAQQSDPDNQLRAFELGDVRLLGTAYCVMPVAGGSVRYWSEWPLEGTTLPAERPTSWGQGAVTMPQREFERKLLALVRQYKGEATNAPATTN